MIQRNALHIFILALFFACSSKNNNDLVWVNQSDSITISTDSLIFNTIEKKGWEAYILSFTQPIPLEIVPTLTGFNIHLTEKSGIVEGPAHLIIKNDTQYKLYPIWLKNKPSTINTLTEYRSPKTVNPDSSLHQHNIYLKIDQWRNLSSIKSNNIYFNEDVIELPSTAGTYLGQNGNPISAYYIQPGSAKDIQLRSKYIKTDNSFFITTDQLRDVHDNIIADGTNMTFTYWNKLGIHRMEALSINGYVSIRIPASEKSYFLYASIDQLKSKTIQITSIK
jgi:hypothetical protein